VAININLDKMIHDIITQYKKYGEDGSDTIQKAYEYAKKCHE
jgi:hypothetical protein